MNDQDWNEKIPKLIDEVYRLSVSLGGAISGEHGIGIIRKPFLPMSRDKVQIEIMKGIKRLFDPNNVLNPGKIFDID